MSSLPDAIARYELLRSLGLRPGSLNPVSAYISAGRQAQAAGIACDYWSVLFPQEREYIIRFKDRHNTPWMYTPGISPVAYAKATDTYTPPQSEKPRGQSYFPYHTDSLRIRGGVLTFPEPARACTCEPLLLLPAPPQPLLLCAPRIAGLLVSGPVYKRVARIELVTNYRAATTARET